MIQIAKCKLRRRWLETKRANRIPQVQFPQDSAHLIQLEWTEQEQVKLKTFGERYTSMCDSAAGRVDQ
jgi:hypothetical protein